MGVFKKLFDELENQCAELDKRIQMELAADSDQNDERILALRAAHQHSSQAQQLHEKANSLKELLNLQSLHSDVTIMPAFFTSMQNEIDRLLKDVKEEVTKQYTTISRMFTRLTPAKRTKSIIFSMGLF